MKKEEKEEVKKERTNLRELAKLVEQTKMRRRGEQR
jgi:hypothetical protein